MVETYQDVGKVLLDIINRIRSLESKYNLLGERLLIVNQNMISQFKKISTEFKVINDDVKEVRADVFKTNDVVEDVTKSMQFFSTKEDIKVLEKYINLWNPLKFVTEDELKKEIENVRSRRRG